MNFQRLARFALPAVVTALLGSGCIGDDVDGSELGTTTQETHAWSTYHWARTANPFTVSLGDNVTSAWDAHLATSSSDWSKSAVLDTQIITGGTTPRKCRATAGHVEVCNASYGNNGWLGVAQIWLSGGHISQGIVKLNDTYFNTSTYNTPAWRNLVMCQEVGHTFGLDHQDVDFNNPPLGTCMDYTSDPTPNQHPNAHDYEELAIIYNHLDSTTTVKGAFPTEGLDRPKTWGELVGSSRGGAQQTYVRDFGGGRRVVTLVTWAQE